MLVNSVVVYLYNICLCCMLVMVACCMIALRDCVWMFGCVTFVCAVGYCCSSFWVLLFWIVCVAMVLRFWCVN